MPLTSFADNETNALGSQRWLHEVERWGNHTHSLVGGKCHKCIPTLKENDVFSWGVHVNQVTLDALIHPLHPVWILILPCFLPRYHLLLPQNPVSFWFGAINCITHNLPLPIRLSIYYIYWLFGISSLGRSYSLEEVCVMLKIVFYNLGTQWKDLQCIFFLTPSSCLEQPFMLCFL